MRVSSIAGTVTVVDDSDVEHDIPFDVDVPEAFSVAVTADSGSIMPNATVNLTATPTGDTDPVTYTWVKPDGTRADGATLAYAPSFAGAEVVAVPRGGCRQPPRLGPDRPRAARERHHAGPTRGAECAVSDR